MGDQVETSTPAARRTAASSAGLEMGESASTSDEQHGGEAEPDGQRREDDAAGGPAVRS